MNVYAVNDPIRQCVLVYVQINPGPTDIMRTYLGDHGKKVYQVAPGEEPPLYFPAIPMDVAEAIGLALAPRPEATERHLDDAIGVRDRLLTMLEGRA